MSFNYGTLQEEGNVFSSETPWEIMKPGAVKRVFDTGATRDTEEGKLDFEGFLTPRVLEAYAKYMNFNRTMRDGSLRESDNWQKGIPQDAYMKSGWRHFFEWWWFHRGYPKGTHQHIVFAICALLFNVMGYLDNLLKENPEAIDEALRVAELKRQQDRRVTAQS